MTIRGEDKKMMSTPSILRTFRWKTLLRSFSVRSCMIADTDTILATHLPCTTPAGKKGKWPTNPVGCDDSKDSLCKHDGGATFNKCGQSSQI